MTGGTRSAAAVAPDDVGVGRHFLPDAVDHQPARSGAAGACDRRRRRPQWRPRPSPGTSRSADRGAPPESRLCSSSRCRKIASSSSAAAASWSWCAPPTGSRTISSIRPRPQQVGRGDLQRLGGLDLALGVAPQDRRAAFRRNHAVDRRIPASARDRPRRCPSAPPLPPSPHTMTTIGTSSCDISRRFKRDGLGDAALLRLDAGIRGRRVDERQHRAGGTSRPAA